MLQYSMFLPVIFLLVNSASETPIRLNRGPHCLLVGCVGIRTFFQVARMAIDMAIPYCMVSVSLAYKYHNLYSPCSLDTALPTLFLRSNLTRLRVVPVAAGQPCASPSH